MGVVDSESLLPSTERQVCQVLTTTSRFLHPLSRSSARGAAVINSTVDISLSWTRPRRPLATGMQRAARAHPTPLSSVASPIYKSRCGTRRQARARDSLRTSVWYPSLAHCVEPWLVMRLQSATMSTKAHTRAGHAWRAAWSCMVWPFTGNMLRRRCLRVHGVATAGGNRQPGCGRLLLWAAPGVPTVDIGWLGFPHTHTTTTTTITTTTTTITTIATTAIDIAIAVTTNTAKVLASSAHYVVGRGDND
jgi:hypothetical protein